MKIILLTDYKHKHFPFGVADVLKIDVEHLDPIEKQDLPEIFNEDEKYLDKDDEDLMDKLADETPVEIISQANTFFLIASRTNGKFKWVSDEDCILFESRKGKKLLQKRKNSYESSKSK